MTAIIESTNLAVRARPRTATVAGWAGVLGPALFTAWFVVQEWFRAGVYDPVADEVIREPIGTALPALVRRLLAEA